MKKVAGHTEVTPAEARAGRRGTRVLAILAISTITAGVIMGAFWTLTAVN